MVEVRGPTVLITGASDGIGAAGARILAQAGCEVVVIGRSTTKTHAVATAIGGVALTVDFTDLHDVRRLAADLLVRYPRIDVLVNNAGGIMGARQVTGDGHERTFQVNHLAPFLLTTLLLDRLMESRASVIATSSAANRAFGHVDLDDLDAEQGYQARKAYGDAKLENILFTKELHRRYHQRGISSAAFHPGNVATNFSHEASSPFRFIYHSPLRRLLRTPEKGCDTMVWLATTRPGVDWTSGEYYVRRRVARANPQANDAELARLLWDRSEQMVRNN